MSYLTRASLEASMDLVSRVRSLAGAIEDLGGMVPLPSGENAAVEGRRLGRIIHFAEMAGEYCEEVAGRLDRILLEARHAGGGAMLHNRHALSRAVVSVDIQRIITYICSHTEAELTQ
jgi:hypothetical protein